MSVHKLGVNVLSCILAMIMVTQAIYIPVHAATIEASTITLESARDYEGNPRILHITFSAPVRFTDDNPAAHIYASSSTSPEDDSNSWNVGLSAGTNNCVAIDPTMVAGHIYASEYYLTFKSDLERTGVIRITGQSDLNSKQNTGNTLTSVCDEQGNELNSNAEVDINGQTQAVAAYAIKDVLLGAVVASPTQAVLFFNYDSKFLAANPCDYIYATDSQSADNTNANAKIIKAVSYEKLDEKRYLITFASVLPVTGNIYIQGSEKSEDKTINIIGTTDGSAKLFSTSLDASGNSIAAASFSSPYMQIVKTEYLGLNKARIYFSEKTKFLSADPSANIMATNYGTPGASDNSIWKLEAKSVTPVDGTMESGSFAYDITFSHSLTQNCSIAITGSISEKDNSLSSVLESIDSRSLYSDYQYTNSDNSTVGMLLIHYITPYFFSNIFGNSQETTTTTVTEQAVQPSNTVVQNETPQYSTAFISATVIDPVQKKVRLTFSSPVHMGTSIAASDSSSDNAWTASLDTGFTPEYENATDINGISFSNSIVVKFGDLQSTDNANTLYNDNTFPVNGSIVVDSDSIIDSAGLAIVSSYESANGNRVSYQQYSFNTTSTDEEPAVSPTPTVIDTEPTPPATNVTPTPTVSDAEPTPTVTDEEPTPPATDAEPTPTGTDQPESTTGILDFTLSGVSGVINNTNDTISVQLPYGISRTSLIATFTLTDGSNITVGGVPQISGVNSNDYTNPVVYSITAQDGTARNYVVTVSCPDAAAPTISAAKSSTWATTHTITTLITDYDSGVAIQKWAEGTQDVSYFATAGTEYTGDSFTATESETYTIYAKDNAGNESITTVSIISVDSTPPTITLEAQTGWAMFNILTAKITDGESGVAEQKWAAGNQDTSYFAAQGTAFIGTRFSVPYNGIYTIYAKDMAGNESVATITVNNIDTTPVLITATQQAEWSNTSVLITTTATDNESGIAVQKWTEGKQNNMYFVRGGGTEYTGNSFSVSKNGIYTVFAKNNADNPAILRITVTHIDTTAPVITASVPDTWETTHTIATAITDSESGVAVQKWAQGTQDISYFAASGTTYTGDSFTATEGSIYTVYAKDNAGNESIATVSIDLTDVTPPSIPSNVTALLSGTDNTISLTWTPSTDNVLVAGYKIFRNDVQVGTSTTTGFTDTGLLPGTSFVYTVSAFDSAENVSDVSAPCTIVTPIDMPGNIGEQISGNQINISWDLVTGASSYDVEVDGVIVASVSTAQYTWSDQQASNTSHTIRVRAKTADTASEWTSSVTAGGFILVGGALTGDTTWSDTSRLYKVESDLIIPVNVTLTVMQGTVILVDPGVKIIVNGTLNISGIAGNLAVITSSKDSDYGGTGVASYFDYWGGMTIGVTGSFAASFTHVRYGQDTASKSVISDGGSISLSDSNIENTHTDGYSIFSDLGLVGEQQINEICSQITAGNFSGQNTGKIAFGGTLQKNLSLLNNSATYVMVHDIIVPTGMSLTFGAGLVVLAENTGITVNGTLNLTGTESSKVILTSVNDPEYGGAGVLNAQNCWNKLTVNSIGVLNTQYSSIKYAGYSKETYNISDSIFISGDATISNSEITNCGSVKLNFSNNSISITHSKFSNTGFALAPMIQSGIDGIQTGLAGTLVFENNDVTDFGGKSLLHLSKEPANTSITSAATTISHNIFAGTTQYSILIEDWNEDISIQNNQLAGATVANIYMPEIKYNIDISNNTMSSSVDAISAAGNLAGRTIKISDNAITAAGFGIFLNSSDGHDYTTIANNKITALYGVYLNTNNGDINNILISNNQLQTGTNDAVGKSIQVLSNGFIISASITGNTMHSAECITISAANDINNLVISGNDIHAGTVGQWGLCLNLNANGGMNLPEISNNTITASMECMRIHASQSINSFAMNNNNIRAGFDNVWGKILTLRTDKGMDRANISDNILSSSAEDINVSANESISGLQLLRNYFDAGSETMWGVCVNFSTGKSLDSAIISNNTFYASGECVDLYVGMDVNTFEMSGNKYNAGKTNSWGRDLFLQANGSIQGVTIHDNEITSSGEGLVLYSGADLVGLTMGKNTFQSGSGTQGGRCLSLSSKTLSSIAISDNSFTATAFGVEVSTGSFLDIAITNNVFFAGSDYQYGKCMNINLGSGSLLNIKGNKFTSRQICISINTKDLLNSEMSGNEFHAGSVGNYGKCIEMSAGAVTAFSILNNIFDSYNADIDMRADSITTLHMSKNNFKSQSGQQYKKCVEIKSGGILSSSTISENIFNSTNACMDISSNSVDGLDILKNELHAGASGESGKCMDVSATESIHAVTISENIFDSTNDGVDISCTKDVLDGSAAASIKNIKVNNNSFTTSVDGQVGSGLIINSSGLLDTINIYENTFQFSNFGSGILFYQDSALSKDIYANFNVFKFYKGSSEQAPYAMEITGDATVNAWRNFWGSSNAPNSITYRGIYTGVCYTKGNIDYSYWIGQDNVLKSYYGIDGGYSPTGVYSQTFSDMKVESPGLDVDFSRSYNSQSNEIGSFGRGWSFGFEGTCQDYTYTVTNTEGTTETKIFDTLKTITLPDGSALSFTIINGKYSSDNSKNTLIKSTDGGFVLTTKNQYVYVFNTAGYLTSVTDANGNTITINLNADGKVQSVSDCVGRQYNVIHNADGMISQITDPVGRTVTYQYLNGQLSSVTDSLNHVVYQYTYDSAQYLTQIKNASSEVLQSITYDHDSTDNKDKVSSLTDKQGNTTAIVYDNVNKTVTVTDTNNRKTIEWFNDAYQVVKTQDAEGKTASAEYLDAAGNICTSTDRNGNTTKREADINANITKIINPDGGVSTYTYDANNNRISEKDSQGNKAFYVYDSHNNLILKAQPLNGTDVYTEGCNLSGFAVTKYTYYANGLIQQMTDPNNGLTTYTYDANGYPQTVSDPSGNVTHYTYNSVGWLLSQTTPKGYTTTYDYDKTGKLLRTTDAGNGILRNVYDVVGRIIQQINANQYNPADDGLNLATPKDTYANANVGDRFAYDTHSNVISKTDPENNTTTYTYDLYGNILSSTQPNGGINSIAYDIMNRKADVYFKDNAQAEQKHLQSFVYTILADGKTQTTTKQFLNATDTATTISTSDYAGRTISQQNPDGTTSSVLYNTNGTVNCKTAVNGAKAYYKYDGLNRVTEQWTQVDTNLYAYTSVAYDKAGNQIQQKSGIDAVALWSVPTAFITTSSTYYTNGKQQSIADNEGRKNVNYYDADGNLIKTEKYTSPTEFTTTESSYNYLEKPVTVSSHVRTGDISGNDFADNSDTVLTTHYTYDKNGNALTVTTPNAVTTTYTYDRSNRQTQVSSTSTDENGQPVTITSSVTYTWDGKVQTSTDANGNVSSNVYDTRGLLTKTIDACGNTTAKYYDNAGRLIAVVLPLNYDPLKTLDQMSRTEYAYDLMGRVKTVTQTYYDNQTNEWVTFVEKAYQYDSLGNVTKELGAIGYASGTGTTVDDRINTGDGILYFYNLGGKLTLKLTSNTEPTQYTYDALGRVTSKSNERGVRTNYTYDGAGKLLTEKVSIGALSEEQTVHSYTYDLLGQVLSQTDGNGNTTSFIYNALGKVRQTTSPGDSTVPALTSYCQYNTSGNVAVMWTSSGKKETDTYDNQGHILSKTQSATDGSSPITVSYRYDKNGNVRYSTDGNGNVTSATYDAMNRTLTQTKGSATDGYQTTTVTYDANGNKVTTTDWRGNTSTNIYDAMNRLVEQKDAYGHTVEKYTYNNNSLQVTATDALGNVTAFTYDREDRLIQTTDPAGHITSQTYNNLGLVDSKTDGDENITSYLYDQRSRLQTVVNAANEATFYTYDANGNVLTQTDGLGHVTTYEYNCRNQLIKTIKDAGRTGTAGNYTYDLSKVQSYTYTADGQAATKTDRNGNTTTYTYDIHGNLLSQTVEAAVGSTTGSPTGSTVGATTVSYTYDNNGNTLTMTDTTGTTTRIYDSFNRTTSKTVPYMGTSTYAYDITADMDAGCTAQTTTDPKGNVTKKIYDRVGRISKVIADGLTTVYHYNDNGSVQSVVYSDGSREDYTYTSDNHLDTLTNTKADATVIDSYSYTYDAAHNMLSKVDARGTTTYTYDSLNRLLTVTEPSGKITGYTYDASGNRLTETDTLGTDITVITYTFDSQNRLTGTVTTLAESTVVTGDEGTAAITTIGAAAITSTVAYTYDNNGNQLTKTTTDYVEGVAQTEVVDQANAYDLFNQLIATVTSAGVIVINTYNGDGLRVGKSVNGELTRYLYEYDKVVLEENAAGDQTGRNVYGINLLTRQAKDDTDTPAYTLTYMYNGHADVTALLDTAGNVIATYYYDAFGNILAQTGIVNNSILYTGYQYDKETGLYYLNARMYDPITARFMQEDTYTGEYNDPLSLNLYTYCKNEPLMYSDPTGHKNYKPGESTAEYYSSQAQAKSKAKSQAKKQASDQADYDSGKNLFGMPTADYSKKQSITSSAKTADVQKAFESGNYSGGMPVDLYNKVLLCERLEELYPQNGNDQKVSDKDMKTIKDAVMATEIITPFEQTFFEKAPDWIGTPYVRGGDTKENNDCGGFARGLYLEMGITIGTNGYGGKNHEKNGEIKARTTNAMWWATENEGERIQDSPFFLMNEKGEVVENKNHSEVRVRAEDEIGCDISQLRPGDVIFYDLGEDGCVDHVALYLGDGKLIENYSDKINLCITDISHWKLEDIVGVKRYP